MLVVLDLPAVPVQPEQMGRGGLTAGTSEKRATKPSR
jgi:hypothetical protein